MEVNKSLKNFDVEVIPVDQKQMCYSYMSTNVECEAMVVNIVWEHAPFSKVISNGSLVESFSFVEELSNVFWSVSEQLILHKEHNALQKGKQSITTDTS